MRKGGGAKRAFNAWAVLVLAFLYLPILVVVIYAFNNNRYSAIWTHFSTHWFSTAINDPVYTSALRTSLKIAIINAVVATVLGTMAALALARMKKKMRVPFDVVVYLTLVVPEIVIGVASLIFFVQLHKDISAFPSLGWVTILIAHVVFNASLVMLIVRARFVGMGSTLEEAAFDLGSGPLSTFRQVTLPRLWPAIMAGALLSFTFSFDDYVLSNFAAGGTTQTWPVLVFSLVRFGPSPEVNAFASMMLLVTLVALLATGLLLRRAARTTGGGVGQEKGSGFGAALGLG